jgi:hypothetical protein
MFRISTVFSPLFRTENRLVTAVICIAMLLMASTLPVLAQEVPTYIVSSTIFPPQGDYVSPPDTGLLTFTSGIVIKNIVNRDLQLSVDLPPLSSTQDYSVSGQIDFLISTDAGVTFTPRTTPTLNGFHLSHYADTGATQYYDGEITQLSISGGDLLTTGIMIRESPTLHSTGKSILTPVVGGGYRLSSFFDVFLELTVDGGLTWAPATGGSIRLRFYTPGESFYATDYMLPANAYLSKPNKILAWTNGVKGKEFDLYSWSATFAPPAKLYSPSVIGFTGWLNLSVSSDGGTTWIPGSATVSVSVQITYMMLDGFTRYYYMEMLALNASGLPLGMMIRESPTRASFGRHSIRLVGASTYEIASFFDVFTEISLDGGATWNPSLGPLRLELFTSSKVIAASATSGGTITPSGDVYVAYDADTTFSITPDPGYSLAGLKVDGNLVTPVSSYSFMHVSEDHTIAATFLPLSTAHVTIGANPDGVSFTVDGSPFSSTQIFSWTSGSVHTISTTTPQSGGGGYIRYVFNEWSDGGGISHTIAPTSDSTFTADFRNQYYLTAAADPGGTAVPSWSGPSGDGFYESGTIVRITATPNSGYYFDGWRGMGFFKCSPIDNPINVIMNSPVYDTAGFSNVPKYTQVTKGWNMVSLPFSAPYPRTDSIYKDASSYAYYFNDGYDKADTIENGKAYWLKFPAAESIGVRGPNHFADEVTVKAGWNMVGSVAQPLLTAYLSSYPPGIVTSQFFKYDRGYTASDTILPGRGYWVKVNSPGTLYLSNIFAAVPKTEKRIRIVPTLELPPAPPVATPPEVEARNSGTPNNYALKDAYPNPFNPRTLIKYDLPTQSVVKLTIYNILGRQVAELVNSVQDLGFKEAEWSASNAASGIYFYHLDAASVSDPSKHFSQTRKMLLVK